MDRKMVNFIKEQYPPGTRIRLNSMEDPYAPIAPGTEGVVDFVDDVGTIHMKWNNGRSLGIVPGEDSFSVLPPKLTTFKLYMPLTAELYERSEYGDLESESTELDGRALRSYQNGNILTGAEYLLEYSTDSGASWQPVFTRTGDSIETGGCTSSVLNNGRLTVNSAGTATFSGLKADRSIIYRLTETSAPEGCTLLAEPLYTGTLPVKVDKSFSSDDCEVIDGENYCYTLYVTAVNGAMYRLPNTGGSGFAYIPIVLCILGAVLYAFTITHDIKSDEKKKEKNTYE